MGFCANALVDRVGGYRSRGRPTLRCRYAVEEAADLFEKRRGLMDRWAEFVSKHLREATEQAADQL